MFEVAKGPVWLSSLASGTPYARGEMRSRDLPQLSKQYLSILPQNLRGLREKKLLAAQRPRTYTHPTRPIKVLKPHAYPQPAPTGQAPVVYAVRCLHVPPGSNS